MDALRRDKLKNKITESNKIAAEKKCYAKQAKPTACSVADMGQHLFCGAYDQEDADETAAESVDPDVPSADLPAGWCRSHTVQSGHPICFEPVALADEEHLFPLVKQPQPDVSNKKVRKSKVKGNTSKAKVHADDTPRQHLSKEIIQSVANMEAALMTGKLKYTTVHAPELETLS